MSIRCITTVFFVLIVSFSCLTFYQPREMISDGIDFALQMIIECLTYVQMRIQRQVIQPIQLNVCTQNCEIEEEKNDYDQSEYEHECPSHRYIIRIIERKPLVIYIEQFLTSNEIEHLIELATPLFKPSMIHDDKGGRSYDQYRTSSSASIRRHQTSMIKCIEKRFAQFQGDINVERLEPFQIVKYTPDQQFRAHYDWFSQSELIKNGGQRMSTFFTYLQANCSLGETEFIDIPFNHSLHGRFCDILICDDQSVHAGIRFRPIPGNSVFWFNIDEQGQIDYSTYHAGRPPGRNGHKIGLNVWTREDIFHMT